MTQEFQKLFFATHSDLCEASAVTSLDDAVAGKEDAIRLAAHADELSAASDARFAKLNSGAAELSDKVNTIRDEDCREFNLLAERALIEDVDLVTESRTSADRHNLLTQLRNILEHAHAVILPRERLAALINRVVLLTARANLASCVALVAGIERFNASKPLLEKDFSVTFAEAGKAWDAFSAQMHAHRASSEAVAVVEAEQARQRMLAAQGVL